MIAFRESTDTAADSIVSRLKSLVRDIETEGAAQEEKGNSARAAINDKDALSARIDAEGWFTEISDIALAIIRAKLEGEITDSFGLLDTTTHLSEILSDCVVHAVVNGEWINYPLLLIMARDALDAAREVARCA